VDLNTAYQESLFEILPMNHHNPQQKKMTLASTAGIILNTELHDTGLAIVRDYQIIEDH
jgi:hypothetical protein